MTQISQISGSGQIEPGQPVSMSKPICNYTFSISRGDNKLSEEEWGEFVMQTTNYISWLYHTHFRNLDESHSEKIDVSNPSLSLKFRIP